LACHRRKEKKVRKNTKPLTRSVWVKKGTGREHLGGKGALSFLSLKESCNLSKRKISYRREMPFWYILNMPGEKKKKRGRKKKKKKGGPGKGGGKKIELLYHGMAQIKPRKKKPFGKQKKEITVGTAKSRNQKRGDWGGKKEGVIRGEKRTTT